MSDTKKKRGANHWDNSRSCANQFCGQFKMKQTTNNKIHRNSSAVRHIPPFQSKYLSKCWPRTLAHSHIAQMRQNIKMCVRLRALLMEKDSKEDQTVLFNLWRFVNIFHRSFNGSYFNSTFIALTVVSPPCYSIYRVQ